MSIGYSDAEERAYLDDLRAEDARKRRHEAHRRHADPFCGCPICEPDEHEDENTDEEEA